MSDEKLKINQQIFEIEKLNAKIIKIQTAIVKFKLINLKLLM